MKILIIGSKGFIGAHALQYFSGMPEEYECYGCDVMVDYTTERYFLLDATNCDYSEIFEGNQFDVCINCSGAASVPDSLVHPLRDFTLNVYNVVKMLDAIRKHAPQCRFINLSSAAVYGNPQRLPIQETDVCMPVSPYGRHKEMAEKICQEYAGDFKLQTCSARIFSAYGPGLKKQLLWDICQKAAQSDIVSLFGTGYESRDFIYVTDIMSAIKLLLVQGNFNGSVYNIANGEETTVKHLAETLLQKLNYKGKLSFTGNQRSGDPVGWKADISKIKDLGYKGRVSLNEGLDQYIQWLKEDK